MNPFKFLGFVVEDAPVQVVAHADVERATRAALHRVHVVAMFAAHELPHLSSRAQHQFRGAELGAESRDLVFRALNCALLMGSASVMDVTFCVGAWPNARSLRLRRDDRGLRKVRGANARLQG